MADLTLMGHSIAVMITKGGVGKSTLVMALAETLSVYHQKSVLVIDSDPQASVSSMLTSNDRLNDTYERKRTISEFLSLTVLDSRETEWKKYVLDQVSDVDDANSISLMPAHIGLSLFEREVATQLCFAELKREVTTLIRQANEVYDLVLIDCPPTLTYLTEAWMTQADYHLSPIKPDYLGLHGLEILNRLEELSGAAKFSERLGVLVNMMDMSSAVDKKFFEVLMRNKAYRCFAKAIASHASVKNSALYHPELRSYMSKYPGVGNALREVSAELLTRLRTAVMVDHAVQSTRVSVVR